MLWIVHQWCMLPEKLWSHIPRCMFPNKSICQKISRYQISYFQARTCTRRFVGKLWRAGQLSSSTQVQQVCTLTSVCLPMHEMISQSEIILADLCSVPGQQTCLQLMWNSSMVRCSFLNSIIKTHLPSNTSHCNIGQLDLGMPYKIIQRPYRWKDPSNDRRL